MAPIDELVDRLRAKIEQNNRMNPGKKIKWDLRGDKLKDLIKHEFSIPDKYIKRKSHQSSKYLSKDEVKYLDSILADLAGEAIEEGINIYPTSPMRSFSRSRTISPVAVVPYRERIARHTRRARARSGSGTRVSGTRASGTRRSGSSTRSVTPPRMHANAVPNNNAAARLRRMLLGNAFY
jgi:hypothetical protein